MARDGYVEVDCGKVRKLLLDDCAALPAAILKDLPVSRSSLTRMLGGEEGDAPSAEVSDLNARKVVAWANARLGPPRQVQLEDLYWSGPARDRSAPVARVRSAARLPLSASLEAQLAERLRDRAADGLQPRTLTDLLNPLCRRVGFLGREREREQIRTWCEDAAPLSVLCVTGDAGAGKTRLGLQVCAERPAPWRTGFFDTPALAAPLLAGGHAEAAQPLLIVIDYAATKRERLNALLARLGERSAQPGAGKIRLLLLERHADPAAGWWSELITPTSPSAWRLGPAFVHTPLRLSALEHDADAQVLAAQTAAAAAALLDLPGVEIDLQGAVTDQQTRIDRAGQALPLKVMMAACLAVIRQGPLVLDQRIAVLAQDLADYELGRITLAARDRGLTDPDSVKWIAAAVTSLGGLPLGHLLTFVQTETALYGGARDPAFAVADALADLLPPRADPAGAALDSLRPDLIGEAFVLRVLNGRAGRPDPRWRALADQAMTRWFDRAPLEVASFLVRTIQDFADEAEHVALGWFDCVIERIDGGEQLAAISDGIPVRTVQLRARSARLLERQLERRDTGHDADLADRARLHHNLSVRLGQLGRRDDAIAHAQTAISIYERLLANGASAYEGDLATAYTTLANRLLTAGEGEAALAAAETATAGLDRLVLAGDDTRRADLSLALNALALCRSATDRHREAVAPAAAAVELLRGLAEAQPEPYEPELAIALGTLAHRLVNVGDTDGAHAAALEALPLARRLADVRPDAFEAELATTLNSVSMALVRAGDRAGGLACAQEIVPIYRRLDRLRPEAFRTDLGVALTNVAACLGALERWREALEPAREAEAIVIGLAPSGGVEATQRAAVHLILGQIHGNLQDHGLAVDHAVAAVDLYRGLAAATPALHQADLAVALDSAATRALEAGRADEGEAWATQAVAAYRTLARSRPEVFSGALAIALNNLANAGYTLGAPGRALKIGRQAVALYRRLARRNPAFYRPGYARAQSNLATFLSGLGQGEAAYTRALGAATLFADLAATDPGAWTASHAGALTSLAIKAGHLGRHGVALRHARRAVLLFRRVVKASAGAAPALFPAALITYANSLEAAGRPTAGVDIAIEAIGHYHARFARFPDAVRADFARAWWSLSDCLWAAGNQADAPSALEEAITAVAPAFVADPDRWLGLMRPLVSDYVRRCDSLGIEANLAVLDPIVRTYQSLQGRADGPG